jgi:hypothetical protein
LFRGETAYFIYESPHADSDENPGRFPSMRWRRYCLREGETLEGFCTMRNTQPPFPIDVRTGWVDYSPAFHYYASQRVRSRLADFTPRVRSVTVRVSDDGLHDIADRRCEIEVLTKQVGLISASPVGADLEALVDRAVESVVQMMHQRLRAEPSSEPFQRIA